MEVAGGGKSFRRLFFSGSYQRPDISDQEARFENRKPKTENREQN